MGKDLFAAGTKTDNDLKPEFSYNELVEAMIESIGLLKRPDPEDGWIKLKDIINKVEREKGLTEYTAYRMVAKKVKEGLIEKVRFGGLVYIREKRSPDDGG